MTSPQGHHFDSRMKILLAFCSACHSHTDLLSILMVLKRILLWSIQIYSLNWQFPRRFYCDPYKPTLYTSSPRDDFVVLHTNLLCILMFPNILLWSIQIYSLYWWFPRRFCYDPYKSSLYTDGSQEDLIMVHTNILFTLTVPKILLWSTKIYSLYWWFPSRFYCDPYKSTLYWQFQRRFSYGPYKSAFLLTVPKTILLWSIQTYSIYWWFPRFYCDPYKSTLYTDCSQDFIVIHINLLSILIVPKILLWSIQIYSLNWQFSRFYCDP